MKVSTKGLILLASSLSLITINFSLPQSAHASVSCEYGTVSSYPNGSLANCLLSQNTTVQVSTYSAGTSTFYCKAKSPIYFDDKGQFQHCQLSEEIQIRQGNSMKICPAESHVYVSISEQGSQSITCSPSGA